MRLFLDASVLLAACGSETGASREIFNRASANEWTLLSSPYVIEESLRNLTRLAISATSQWTRLRPSLILVDDILTIDRPVLFNAAKDRPILFTAFAWADVLLTLDHGDFSSLLGSSFYGLLVLKPGSFLEQQRREGILK